MKGIVALVIEIDSTVRELGGEFVCGSDCGNQLAVDPRLGNIQRVVCPVGKEFEGVAYRAGQRHENHTANRQQ